MKIGTGLSSLGHSLLRRNPQCRLSPIPASGRAIFPIVLSELGADAGIVGAARLISDAVYDAD